jgi:hypothetical protein
MRKGRTKPRKPRVRLPIWLQIEVPPLIINRDPQLSTR